MQGAVQKLPASRELFQALYNHFLCLADVGLQSWGPASSAAAGDDATAHGVPALAAFAAGDAEGDRQLCVRAMTAVYHHHAATIGRMLHFLLGLVTCYRGR